jgi:hypothetical protein
MKLSKKQAEVLRVAVFEYTHAMTALSAYRVRAAYTSSSESAEHSAAAVYWATVAETDRAKLAAFGIEL